MRMGFFVCVGALLLICSYKLEQRVLNTTYSFATADLVTGVVLLFAATFAIVHAIKKLIVAADERLYIVRFSVATYIIGAESCKEQ